MLLPIHIDSREGGKLQSKTTLELQHKFTTHRFHPPTDIQTMEAGDFSFIGNGPHHPLNIAFERKRLGSEDFFHSIYSGRLAGEQFPKLLDLYDVVYLIIEGQARVDPITGEIEEYWGGQWRKVGKGRKSHTGEELLGMINTITLFTPIRIIRTFGMNDTVDVIATLWHWWQKPWSSHGTLKAIYTPQTTLTIGKASTVRRIAAQLPGIGWEKSGVADMRFRTIEEMILAPPSEWEKLPGFGKTLAKRVTDEIKGEVQK